ncbi:hypothetical protein C8T65DRAFT_829892 [Cerioporus squamosus]|nr:hypothetical protein C8T65DRAFT_829892 [Cerioporus squamosus]
MVAAATVDPLQLASMEGEIDAIYYCWKKSKARFKKGNRYESFLNLVADLQGDTANQRSEDSDEVRMTLKALQECSAADQARLIDVGLKIERIRDLVLKNELVGTDEPTYGDQRVLSKLRLLFHSLVKPITESSHLWSLCTAYLAARLKPQQHINRPAQVHTNQTTSAAEQAVPAPFDVGKWLNKVVPVSRDYAQILSVTRSPTMASVLFCDRSVEVILVPNSKPQRQIATIYTSVIKATLRKAGWTDVDDDLYEALVENLRGNLNAYEAAATIPGELNFFIHCECALLAHLHNSEDIDSVIPYVGVSKLSCWLCWTYFECYRAITGSLIRTRGTHGDLVAWQTPSLSRDLYPAVDTDIRKKLGEQLMVNLRIQAQAVRAHHRSMSTSSQSTVASEPGSEIFIKVDLQEQDAVADELLDNMLRNKQKMATG